MKVSFFSNPQPPVAPTLIEKAQQKGQAIVQFVQFVQSKLPTFHPVNSIPLLFKVKEIEVKKTGFFSFSFSTKKPAEQPKPKFSKLAIAGAIAASAVVLGAAGFAIYKLPSFKGSSNGSLPMKQATQMSKTSSKLRKFAEHVQPVNLMEFTNASMKGFR